MKVAKTSSKRERTSTSKRNQRKKDTPKISERVENAVRQGRNERRSQAPPSRTNSAEVQPPRRSARLHVEPGFYKQFFVGEEIEPEPIKLKLNETQMKLNAIKVLGDKLETRKPREVEILLLKDMDEAYVLNTFEAYRSDFDGLFKESEHEFETESYMHIGHYHVLDILNKKIRDSMVKKLALVYYKSSKHCTLIFNGLLPLWIIRLFMDKYNLTQVEAAQQIGEQLVYHTYLKAVNNEPISSDWEGGTISPFNS